MGTDIPDNFLKDNPYLTGTLKLGAAVTRIGEHAFAYTKLTGVDLWDAVSLVSIGEGAFFDTDITGTIVTPFTVPTFIEANAFPSGVTIVSIPELKKCAVAPSGTEPCWELAYPDMTDIPDNFLKDNPYLTGTLKLGAAVKTIGTDAFIDTMLTSLDLSDAASLVSIGTNAFRNTRITGTLVIPANVKTIGGYAFTNTKLTGRRLDLSNAASLVSIGAYAFAYTDITGTQPRPTNGPTPTTLLLPTNVKTIGDGAFYNTKLRGLDLSEARSLVSIGAKAFLNTDIAGTIVTPFNVPTYDIGVLPFRASFPFFVNIINPYG